MAMRGEQRRQPFERKSAAKPPFAGDAVLREVRPLVRLVPVLVNARSVLPQHEWIVHFVHGPSNTQAVHNSPPLARAIAAGQLRLQRYTMFGTAVGEVLDRHEHFNYQKTAEFWGTFARPWLLLFEPDTVFCPAPSLPLSAFSDYAFVGAPWGAYTDGSLPAFCNNLERRSWHCVGNSGFSLWRRDVLERNVAPLSMLELTPLIISYLGQRRGKRAKPGFGVQKGLRKGHAYLASRGATNASLADMLTKQLTSVDIYMATVLQALAHYGRLPIAPVPSAARAARFSVETVYDDQRHIPCGVHKPWRFLSADKMKQLMHNCPPLEGLIRATVNESARADGRIAQGEQARLANLLHSQTTSARKK